MDANRERARLTFDLNAAGESMMQLILRRRFPTESPEEIEGRLIAWLRERPGAENGDAGPPPYFLQRPLRARS